MRIQNKLGNLMEHTVMITCRGEAEGTKKRSRRMSRRNSLSDVPQVSKTKQSLYKDVVDKHSGLDFPYPSNPMKAIPTYQHQHMIKMMRQLQRKMS